MDKWSVVAFRTGKLSGTGYGNEFDDGWNDDTNYVFIIDVHTN